MPRVISLLVLLAIILLVGAVFFQVMAQFIVPLFLASVLLVVFHPLHVWVLERLPKYPRLSAFITTVLILLVVLLPITWLAWNAYFEGRYAVKWLRSDEAADLVGQVYDWGDRTIERVTGQEYEPPSVQELLARWTASIGQFLLTGVQTVLGILIGLVITVISLYFFLVDGPAMIRTLMQISPLDDQHELELLARFGQVSRSVVVATGLSAIAQGIAAGIGYYFVLPDEAPLFLLTALTMLLAIVPFVGAAGVWVPVAIGLLLLGTSWPVVLGFAIYCAVVVSGLDNIIKPYVLHGQSNLHPLLALLSILGGVQVLGPIGILVGPMLVSFLQALLTIFRREMEQWEHPRRRRLSKLSPAAEALAESIEASVEVEETTDRPATGLPKKAATKPATSKRTKQRPAKARRRRG